MGSEFITAHSVSNIQQVRSLFKLAYFT
ncbi:unnamed protein product [Linum tenue]|uniref:Uncharacterized protein n=1 Tax=Linum tenue TaxID=586396 RepID=A0AAV0N8E5_9ROSI|nr:unnamed protein product [Linum tenue]